MNKEVYCFIKSKVMKDELNEINELKNLLEKRDILIYNMMKNTFAYQEFMIKKSIDVDILIKKFKSSNNIVDYENIPKRRIVEFGKDWR